MPFIFYALILISFIVIIMFLVDFEALIKVRCFGIQPNLPQKLFLVPLRRHMLAMILEPLECLSLDTKNLLLLSSVAINHLKSLQLLLKILYLLICILHILDPDTHLLQLVQKQFIESCFPLPLEQLNLWQRRLALLKKLTEFLIILSIELVLNLSVAINLHNHRSADLLEISKAKRNVGRVACYNSTLASATRPLFWVDILLIHANT